MPCVLFLRFSFPFFLFAALRQCERPCVCVRVCAPQFVLCGRLLACVHFVCLVVLIAVFSGNTTHTMRLYAPTLAKPLFLFFAIDFDSDGILLFAKVKRDDLYSLPAAALRLPLSLSSFVSRIFSDTQFIFAAATSTTQFWLEQNVFLRFDACVFVCVFFHVRRRRNGEARRSGVLF